MVCAARRGGSRWDDKSRWLDGTSSPALLEGQAHSVSAGSQLSSIPPAKNLAELNPSSSRYQVFPSSFSKPAAKYSCCLDLSNSGPKPWNLALTTLFRERFLGSHKRPGPDHVATIPLSSLSFLSLFLSSEKLVLKPAWRDSIIYIFQIIAHTLEMFLKTLSSLLPSS